MCRVVKVVIAAGLVAMVIGQGCPLFNLPEIGTRAEFERVWGDFNARYARFQVPAVEDWDHVYADYAGQFVAELSPDEFARRIAAMLAELKDPQVRVTAVDGANVPVVQIAIPRNYPDDYSIIYFPNGLQQLGSFPLRHGLTAGGIAYVSIESLAPEAWQGLTAADVEGLIAAYASAPSLIIDIRRVTGGSEAVALQIASHFADDGVAYGFSQVRTDPADRTALGATHAHTLQPAAGARYTKPVALLTGQNNMDGAEWFILMMRATGRTVVVGDTSRGACGAVEAVTLANGVQYTIPVEAAFSATMQSIEGEGVHPDLWIETARAIAAPEDKVLERAIDALTD